VSEGPNRPCRWTEMTCQSAPSRRDLATGIRAFRRSVPNGLVSALRAALSRARSADDDVL
jgi:hypothetical protein